MLSVEVSMNDDLDREHDTAPPRTHRPLTARIIADMMYQLVELEALLRDRRRAAALDRERNVAKTRAYGPWSHSSEWALTG